MFTNTKSMQPRVRAIIILDSKLLVIKRMKRNSVYWVLPGGGIEKGETQREALFREIKEEVGVEVEVDALFKKKEITINDVKQKEYFYLCGIIKGTVGSGQGPEFQKDSGYVGTRKIEWVNVSGVRNIDLLPHEIRDAVYFKFYSGSSTHKTFRSLSGGLKSSVRLSDADIKFAREEFTKKWTKQI